MSRRRISVRQRELVVAIVLLSCAAVKAPAQSRTFVDDPPFAAGAVMVGPLGFARPPVTTVVAGGYAYAPVHQILVGAQGGSTIGDGRRSTATYAMATAGYATSRGYRWQVYPFIGVGAGTLRARRGSNHTGLLVGAGFGADVINGTDNRGVMLGTRLGYVTRSMNDDQSVAYVALSFGVGGRPQRTTVAQTHGEPMAH
jgi:hypothetical protein